MLGSADVFQGRSCARTYTSVGTPRFRQKDTVALRVRNYVPDDDWPEYHERSCIR